MLSIWFLTCAGELESRWIGDERQAFMMPGTRFEASAVSLMSAGSAREPTQPFQVSVQV
jgi:hypothetical protein